jgi:hypothetical protein
MILGDKPLIFEVVLSHFGGGTSSRWWRSDVVSCSYGGGATSFGSTSGQEALGRLIAAQQR